MLARPQIGLATKASRRTTAFVSCSQSQGGSMPGVVRKASLLASVARIWAAREQVQAAAPCNPQELRSQMQSMGHSCMAAVALPLAAVSMGGAGMGDLYAALSKGIDVYLLILTVRVLLTWFRQINWYSEPFRFLRTITDPVLNGCRGIIPPISGIDVSPMLLFFGLNFVAKQLRIMAINA